MATDREQGSSAPGLADRIKAVRIHHELTQVEFAKRLGVSRSYLTQVEAGQKKASIEMLTGIVTNIGGVDATWLLSGKGEMLLKTSFETTEVRDSVRRKRKQG